MSRSYKKNIFYKSTNCKKKIKRYANKRVRKLEYIQNGNWYRKVFDPWEINDYCFPYNGEFFWSNWFQEWIQLDPLWKARMK